MDKSVFEVYYVNKFSWVDSDAMASVSTFSMYALAKAGVKTTLIAEGNPGTDCESILRERFGLEPDSNFSVRLFKRTIFKKTRFTSLLYLRACAAILHHRRRNVKTMVISRNTTFLPWLVALKRLFGCTVFFESHAYHGMCTLPGIPAGGGRKTFSMPNQYYWIERLFINGCDGLICQAGLQRELYVKDFVRIPTEVIPHGSQLRSGSYTGAPEERRPMRKKIAYIGNYFLHLDADIILDALMQCKDRGISFLWIGMLESDRPRFMEEAARRGIGEVCEFTGWMPHQSMLERLRSEAGAGIILYRPLRHNCALISPTKIFDYFAAGLPVIGPDFPSVTDHVRNGIDGVLYKAGNVSSLVKAIGELFADEPSYRTLQMNATAAARRCSWENRTEKFIAFAEKCL
jgi:glycosyltransferase involved in cell wall biosynthesis